MEQALSFYHNCQENNITQGRLVTDQARGEILCQNCGKVFKERIVSRDREKTVHSFEQFLSTDHSQSGKLSYINKGLSTTISKKNTDSAGNRISSNNAFKFARLRLWHNRSQKKRNRTMGKAFLFLDSMKSKLGLSSAVVEKTAYYYRKASNQKLTRGKSVQATILACLYAACRESGTPRSLDEIAKVGNVKRKAVARVFKTISITFDFNFAPDEPKNYVNKVASFVESSEKTKRTAYQILDAAKKQGLTTSKKPLSLTGAAVYLASIISNEQVSYKQISKITNVSTVTLRKIAKLMINNLKNEPVMRFFKGI